MMKQLLALYLLLVCQESFATEAFVGQISEISPSIESTMRRYSWHAGCPVPIRDLRYLQLSYWGFDNRPHVGGLIVNKALAHETVTLFQRLYQQHFPIERMQLIDVYHGNDLASMEANNTSAFNCRDLTGLKGVFSQHSYGRAIDINPKINPFVEGSAVYPRSSRRFAPRDTVYPGKITQNSSIVHLFEQYGWDWAGAWFDVQDYQHFEKRANGRKRNPYGH